MSLPFLAEENYHNAVLSGRGKVSTILELGGVSQMQTNPFRREASHRLVILNLVIDY